MADVELLLPAHATIAESLLWEPGDRVLYWIDVKAPALHRLDPVTLKSQRWELPEDVGGYALLEGAQGALVALRSGLFQLEFAGGTLERIVEAPWDPARFRFNESICDADGRFWIGCMCDPQPGADQTKATGPLHSWRSDEGLREFGDRAECHNGMGWSPDGGTCYLSHSNPGVIFAYEYRDGTLGERRRFAQPAGPGLPDGAAVDEEGAYWCAMHGAGCLHRYAPDGELIRVLELPVKAPTMCAFGGEDLRTLFIASASTEPDPGPLAGNLFRFDPGVRGLPRPTQTR